MKAGDLEKKAPVIIIYMQITQRNKNKMAPPAQDPSERAHVASYGMFIPLVFFYCIYKSYLHARTSFSLQGISKI